MSDNVSVKVYAFYNDKFNAWIKYILDNFKTELDQRGYNFAYEIISPEEQNIFDEFNPIADKIASDEFAPEYVILMADDMINYPTGEKIKTFQTDLMGNYKKDKNGNLKPIILDAIADISGHQFIENLYKDLKDIIPNILKIIHSGLGKSYINNGSTKEYTQTDLPAGIYKWIKNHQTSQKSPKTLKEEVEDSNSKEEINTL
jgi:hypothetical protein